MVVGPSGHGKSTLLSHLKSTGEGIIQPVTFFDRQQQAYRSNNISAVQSHCSSCKES